MGKRRVAELEEELQFIGTGLKAPRCCRALNPGVSLGAWDLETPAAPLRCLRPLHPGVCSWAERGGGGEDPGGSRGSSVGVQAGGSLLFSSSFSASGMEVRAGFAGLCFHVPAWGTNWRRWSWSLQGSRSRDQVSPRAWEAACAGRKGERPGPTRPRNYQLHSLLPGS